jgi:integrase
MGTTTDKTDFLCIGDRVVIYCHGKKGIYIADFWEGNCHRRKSQQTSNRKEAVRRATKLANDLLCGTFQTVVKPVTLTETVERYLAHLRTEGRAKRTIVKYAGVLALFTEFVGRAHNNRLDRVSATHFDDFRTERAAKKHRKTVYTQSIVIKQFMKWARTRKLIAENPLAEVKIDKPKLEKHPGPNLDQVNQILAAAPEPLTSMFTMLAFTGIRSGELMRLRKEDVDLDGNWLHVRSPEGGETKNHLSRKVPIHVRLRPVVQAWLKVGWQCLYSGESSEKVPAASVQVKQKNLNNNLAALLKAIALPTGRKTKGFVVHSLRHIFETFCVNNGVPQRAVDAWMGHAPGKSMGTYYYQLDDAESQIFMVKVPFGIGRPAAGIGKEELK